MTALADDGFEVVPDEDTFEVAVIKLDEHHTLYSKGEQYWVMDHNSGSSDHPWFLRELWDEYFKRIWHAYLDSPQVYDAPNGSLIYSSKYYGVFTIKELVGEWAKVETQNSYWEEEDIFPKEGWIKWADGEALLVNPIEEAYY
ncbi:MAG: hypothetical protein LBG19_01260 [Prevotellaceae bacterium]|jgi:hypothetical protein|nr:hypothetical protein [Prevotellaceae bacterium]